MRLFSQTFYLMTVVFASSLSGQGYYLEEYGPEGQYENAPMEYMPSQCCPSEYVTYGHRPMEYSPSPQYERVPMDYMPSQYGPPEQVSAGYRPMEYSPSPQYERVPMEYMPSHYGPPQQVSAGYRPMEYSPSPQYERVPMEYVPSHYGPPEQVSAGYRPMEYSPSPQYERVPMEYMPSQYGPPEQVGAGYRPMEYSSSPQYERVPMNYMPSQYGPPEQVSSGYRPMEYASSPQNERVPMPYMPSQYAPQVQITSSYSPMEIASSSQRERPFVETMPSNYVPPQFDFSEFMPSMPKEYDSAPEYVSYCESESDPSKFIPMENFVPNSFPTFGRRHLPDDKPYAIGVTGSFLFWGVEEDYLGFAIEGVQLDDPETPEKRLVTHDPAWSPGMRFGFSVTSKDCQCPAGFAFNWTYFQTSSDARARSTTERDSVLVTAVSNFPTFSSPVIANRAKSRFNFRFNEFTLDITSLNYNGSCITARPYAGIIGAAIIQKQDINYFDALVVQETLDFLVVRKVDFYGIGPRFGASGSLRIYDGFSFISDASIGLLFGRHNTRNFVKGTTGSPNLLSEVTQTVNRGRLMASGSIGIEWRTAVGCGVEFYLSAVYEMQYWWQQSHLISNLNDDAISGEGRWGDLAMQGGVFSVKLLF
jgi:hypothetical protein